MDMLFKFFYPFVMIIKLIVDASVLPCGQFKCLPNCFQFSRNLVHLREEFFFCRKEFKPPIKFFIEFFINNIFDFQQILKREHI